MHRLFLALILWPLSAWSNTYTTNFPLSENPIFQSGNWINGGTTGLDWSNVQTIPGRAIGTMPGVAGGNAQYADSTAVLAGTWGPTQTAQATIFVNGATGSPSVFEEVELRLRTTITPHSITGYEINCSVSTNPSNFYVQIIRWNGPLGSFTFLDSRAVRGGNGDVFKATVSGSTITAYLNGVQIVQVTDQTFTNGSPGIGFFLQGASGLNANYGFSNFTATDGAGPTQTPAEVPVPGVQPGPTIVSTVPNPPDFDGDGKEDLLWRNTVSGEVGIWLMNGAAAKSAVVIGAPPLSWVIVNTGDFDGDGDSDILWQLGNTNQYGVWFMVGTRIAAIQNVTLPAYAGQVCGVGDFDGDGLADLVTYNRSGGAVYFWKNSGSLRFVQQTSYAVSAASGWLPIGTIHLNGSSQPPEVAWQNANTGEIAVWFMNSFNWVSSASFGNPGAGVALRGFGDFSGDGQADLLLFNTATNGVGYWRSNGSQSPIFVSLAQVSGTWAPVGAEDLGGTGRADIIWRQASTGALGTWSVNGSTFSVGLGASFVGASWQVQPTAVSP